MVGKMETLKSSFSQVISGKSILLTGATGFLAKVFLEKILRVGPNVDKIYLLIRSKDYEHSLSRLENDIFSSPLFATLYSQLENNGQSQFLQLLRDKIRFVSGDTSKPRMGLSTQDYLMLLSKVDYIVNSAASTDFMSPLDEAVSTNTLSVKNIVHFLKASSKARLLHVSTCYIHESKKDLVSEHSPQVPKQGMGKLSLSENGQIDTGKILSNLNELVQSLNKRTYQLKGDRREAFVQAGYNFAQAHGWFNIYTFTKWLGESVLQENKDSIYCSVIRPSIVESCLYEPFAGWIEGLKVADPLIYGVGMNKIPFFPGSHSTVLDLVPVDVVSNAMFLGLIEVAQKEQPGISIYQVCSGGQKPLNLGLITDIVRSAFDAKPIFHRVMLPSVLFWSITYSLISAKKMSDKVLSIFGIKVKNNIKSVQRMLQLARIYQPYTNIQCRFDNKNLLDLLGRMTQQDQLMFPVSLANLDWKHYLGQVHIPGLKKFVVNNRSGVSMSLISQATKKVNEQTIKKVGT